jgi:hypothetical protein
MVVFSATLISGVGVGDGVMAGRVGGPTGVIVGDEVTAAGRCVVVRCVVRGDGVVTEASARGVGLTVGVLVGVGAVTAGVSAAVAGSCVVAVGCCALLFAPLRPGLRRVGVVAGGAISVEVLEPATSVVGFPVICRGRRLFVLLDAVAVLDGTVVLGAVVVGGIILAVVGDGDVRAGVWLRAGVGEGEATATGAVVLDSTGRAGPSRRALSSSLS